MFVCFFTKYRVNEDSRAGKRLRLVLVLRETNVESGPAEKSTTTLIEGIYFGNDAFHGSLRCMIALKGKEGLREFQDGSSSLCQFD